MLLQWYYNVCLNSIKIKAPQVFAAQIFVLTKCILHNFNTNDCIYLNFKQKTHYILDYIFYKSQLQPKSLKLKQTT